MDSATLDELCINTVRFLAVDAVEQAGSGHPGAPLGEASLAYTLWDRFLKHNPQDPDWPDRDRFILSNGHASAMLYALLHLTGYGLSLDDLKNFRQWGSKTPGHPEYGLTPGVEMTTGPLGQGFAHGVGMAMAERWLAGHYNRPGHEIVNHFTYAIVSDGDLQEGVASEAASLSGTLRLGKLIYLYDDNDISIEGNTDIAFAENVAQRFQAYGWHVIGPIDGMDPSCVDAAIAMAQKETSRPSLVICRTIIGYGSPNRAGTAGVHGEPLGPEETRLTKANLSWEETEPFFVPSEALNHFRQVLERGDAQQKQWQTRLEAYRQAYPEEAGHLEEAWRGDLPQGWDDALDGLFSREDVAIATPTLATPTLATREASGRVMNQVAEKVHAFMGGSADLAPSTKTLLKDHGHYGFEEYCGHNLHFGVREHAMGSIANGMALHGGAIPYTATFLVFSDYMRPAIRLGALMGLRVIYLFTHDSIGMGQDGPTHQPIEHLAALRAIPNLAVFRPADATETVEAWRAALTRTSGPTVLALSRQNLPVLDRSSLAPSADARRGGYALWESSTEPQVILMATGSEVHIVLEAGKTLAAQGIAAKVVSMPCWEIFEEQPQGYRDSVLPPEIKSRLSIEAGSTMGWHRYVGSDGVALGLSDFGASAPAEVLYQKLGLTSQRVVEEALRRVTGESS